MNRLLLIAAVLSLLVSPASAADNYQATQGSGLTFAAKDSSAVLFPRVIGCDNTTTTRCWVIDASGHITSNSWTFDGTGNAITSTGGALDVNVKTNAATNQSVNVAQIAATTTATGSGTMNGGTQRMALATDSPGIVTLGQATKANSVPVTFASDQDPCSYAQKSSASISVTSATTTSLVAVSGSTAVYVCGFSFTIAPSATSADTAQLEYGTGASCTGTHALTGTYGNGDLTTSAPPLPVSYGGGLGTVVTAPASNGVCLVTAGTTVNVQGVLTYVQQ
jgi:hypothetical protein